VFYTPGNSPKLVEWVKKGNFSTAAFRKGGGEGGQIPVKLPQLKHYSFNTDLKTRAYGSLR